MKAKIKKNQTVVVIAGKSKGQQGEVLRVDMKRQMVFVKGVNMQQKHTKPKAQDQPGGIISQEGPLHISNVLAYCDHCNKGVRKLCNTQK